MKVQNSKDGEWYRTASGGTGRIFVARKGAFCVVLGFLEIYRLVRFVTSTLMLFSYKFDIHLNLYLY